MSLQKISLLSIVNRSFTVFISILLLSHSVVATASTSIEVAQQSQPNSQDANIAAANTAMNQANQLLKEGQTLLFQKTVESNKQALAKYDEALKILRQIDVNQLPTLIYTVHRGLEAEVINGIASTYSLQFQPQKALEYWNQALDIRSDLNKRLEEAISITTKDISQGDANSNLKEKQQLLDFYKKQLDNNIFFEGLIFNSLGNNYFLLNNKEEALKSLKQALLIFQEKQKPSFVAQVNLTIGQVHLKYGEYKQALNFANQALSLQRDENNIVAQADILLFIGLVSNQLGKPKEALEYYDESLSLYRKINNLNGQVDILDRKGSLYNLLGENEKAIKLFNQALNLLKTAQGNLSEQDLVFNFARQALILQGLAATNVSLGDYSNALEIYKQAQLLAQKSFIPGLEADVLMAIGRLYETLLGDKQKAREAYNQAQELQRATTTPANKVKTIDKKKVISGNQADTLNAIAGTYSSSGDYQESLNLYKQALEIQQRLRDTIGEGNTLFYIADVYKLLGDYEQSIENYNKALEIYNKEDYLIGKALTNDAIGSVWQTEKDYDNALIYYKKALQLWRKQQNIAGEYGSLLNIGRAYELLKKHDNALATAKEALSLAHKQKSSLNESLAYALMGIVYQAQGDYQKALGESMKAADGFRKLGSRPAEANALGIVGKAYSSLNQLPKAVETYEKELELRKKLDDAAGQAGLLHSLAEVERDRKNYSQAFIHIKKTIEIVENIRSNVKSSDLRTSYFATVQKYYEFYIDLLMQLHKKDPTKVCEFKTKELNIKDRCDAVALHMSERARARSLVELLTEAKADIRSGVDSELLQQEKTIQQEIDALEKQKLELMEKQKLELMEKQKLELSYRPKTDEQITQKKQQIDARQKEYQRLQDKIRVASPRYAKLKFPEPLTLKEIQQKVLDDDTLLLTYSLGEERSYLWLVSKTEIHSYELPKRADIEGKAEDFHKYLKKNNQTNSQAATELSKMLLKPVANKCKTEIQSYELPKRTKIEGEATQFHQYLKNNKTNSQAATELSKMLLKPVANKLGKKRLLIVSDGALQYVPFTALPSPEHTSQGEKPIYLLENHEIINSPSASTIAILRSEQRKPAPKTLAVLADPVFSKNDIRFQGTFSLDALPEKWRRVENTGKVAHKILKLVQPSECIEAFGFDANRAFATNPELSQYRYVMFATHGDINTTNPELSSLVLSLLNEKGEPENGYLRLNDIFNLNLPAELVVLSACDTGLGKLTRGEGLVGFTRGFMYAGSPRLVVSLWQIADDGTAVFMENFFRKMLKEGLKPAEALRAAQKEMLKDEKYSAPYYWAAFTLQGEWR